MSCNVCVEKFNRSTRVETTCDFCDFKVCRECCATYLLDTSELAHCMSCKHEWNREFLFKKFTRKFINTNYKKHKEQILFDKERALLPATQPIVEEIIRKEGLEQEISDYRSKIITISYMMEECKKLTNSNRHLNERNSTLTRCPGQECRGFLSSKWKCGICELWCCPDCHEIKGYDRNTEHTCKQENIYDVKLKERILNYRIRILNLVEQIKECERLVHDNPNQKESNTFVRNCPGQECRGFLSSQWKCGICDLWCCPDCHEIKGYDRNTEHVCKQENIDTAKLLEKDTKSCPQCATPIFKIEGCDQMFCTQCQTPFSWESGRVDSGTIHNPHYFEWIRRNGNTHVDRNLLEVRCGREIDNHFINSIKDYVTEDFLRICRYIIHIRYILLPQFANGGVTNNEDLRIQFLRNRITETKFKILLQQRNKQNEKKQEIGNVFNMFINTSTEIIYKVTDMDAEQNIKNELKSLIEYTNECFLNISKIYKCRKSEIDPTIISD